MKKLENIKIFIIGLRESGIEVAKNLILTVPKIIWSFSSSYPINFK